MARSCTRTGCVGCTTTTGCLRLVSLMLLQLQLGLMPGFVRINQSKCEATFLEITANSRFDGVKTLGGEGIRFTNDGQKVDAFGEIANHAQFALGKRSACPTCFGLIVVVCRLCRGRSGTGAAHIGVSAGSCGDWARMCASGGSRGGGGDSGWRMVVASSLWDDNIGI